jgi:hypothetical protein
MALVVVNSYIGIPGGTGSTQSGGFVGVSIDSNAPVSPLDEVLYFSNTVVGSTAVGMAANDSASVILSGLPPEQHTFETFEMVYMPRRRPAA